MGASIGGLTALLAMFLLAWLAAPSSGDTSPEADRSALEIETTALVQSGRHNATRTRVG